MECFQTIQCPIGFLASLDGATRPRASGPPTTDLLVHGILTTASSGERPPTPPVSSSPETEEMAITYTTQQLRIYATPISGSLVARAQAIPDRDGIDAVAGHEQIAQFLADDHSPSPKRKRVETLFESVAQHHKRVRHKGGEGVSLLMAQNLSQHPQQQSNPVKRESEEPGLPILSKIASHRSRSISTSSNLNPNKTAETRTENTRPSSSWSNARHISSKRGTPAPGLSAEASTQRDSVLSSALLSSEDREPRSEPKCAEHVVLDNKNIITRTILTCMRLYGFNRTARPASSHRNVSQNSMALSQNEGRESQIPIDNMALPASSSSTDEDEFKAMYHATYRASTFALRKYLKEPIPGENRANWTPPVLEKGKAMTYIDGFLKLFCEEEH